MKVHPQPGVSPARIVSSLDAIPPEYRTRAFAGQVLDLRYYEVLRETLGHEFEQRYLLMENPRTGELAIQPFFLVPQDLLAGLPALLQFLLGLPRLLFSNWLQLRMLVAGCVAGEGGLDCPQPWALEALVDALEAEAKKCGARLILFKDFPASERPALAALNKRGFRRVPSMPACERALDFKTFEQFLSQKLHSTFRQSLRRKLRDRPGAPPLSLEVVGDARPVLAELHALYLQTWRRSHMRFEKLTPEFFARLGEEMPDRVRFFLWRIEGRLVAFSLCLIHEGTLFHLNVGFDYSVALGRHLYFVTFRDLIEWALAQGLVRYHTGQLNYDPKLHLRLKLAPLDLYARHTSPWLNPLFKIALGLLGPTRHEALLRRFENASDL